MQADLNKFQCLSKFSFAAIVFSCDMSCFAVKKPGTRLWVLTCHQIIKPVQCLIRFCSAICQKRIHYSLHAGLQHWHLMLYDWRQSRGMDRIIHHLVLRIEAKNHLSCFSLPATYPLAFCLNSIKMSWWGQTSHPEGKPKISLSMCVYLSSFSCAYVSIHFPKLHVHIFKPSS